MAQKYPVRRLTCVATAWMGDQVPCGLPAVHAGLPHGWLCQAHADAQDRTFRRKVVLDQDDQHVQFILGTDARAFGAALQLVGVGRTRMLIEAPTA